MRFVIVGPGALGCLMAARLAAAATGAEVWVLDHNRERAAHLEREGILYEKADRQLRFPVRACADPLVIGGAEALFLCVKSYDLDAALRFVQPLLLPRTLLIFMQNGIGHLECVGRAGETTPVFGCTTEGATLLGPGHVRHAGEGTTFLGFPAARNADSSGLLAQTIAGLQAGGFVASEAADILAKVWAKLFVNVGINALTAIHDCLNGELLTIAGALETMRGAVGEAQRLAAAKGIPVATDPFPVAVAVCRATAGNISSMRQDVLRKRRTEIEAINGAVVREAAHARLATPVNAMLVEKIKAIEASYGCSGGA